jgi:hypothetical protein
MRQGHRGTTFGDAGDTDGTTEGVTENTVGIHQGA